MGKSFQGARILLVHAHPDDETINNGATMAMYAALGARVTLITCTRGEEGEVLVPELAHIAASNRDELGAHREVELADAMRALGVADFRFLGAPDVSYRDSGMMDTPPNNPTYYAGAAECYAQLGDVKKGLDLLTRMENNLGANSGIAIEKFKLLVSVKRDEEAINVLKEAKKKFSGEPMIIANLVDYYLLNI